MGDWRRVSLEAVAEIRSSNVDKKPRPGEEPIRLCNYMDVYASEYITKDVDFMEATATPSELSRFRINSGDVMITKDSETPDDIGVAAVATDEISRLVCGYHLALIKPNRDEVDPIYLAKQLSCVEVSRYFGRSANGSTRYGLSSRTIAEAPIRLAPLREQQRVGEILSTIDEVIKQTEALVGKFQQVRAGLLDDIFTRGLMADGQLRPTRQQSARLYKESPLGWIPSEWRILPLDCVVDSMIDGPFGSNLKTEHYVQGDAVRVVRLQNIQEGEYCDSDRVFVSESHAATLARHTVLPGDVLTAALGEDRYPAGRSCCYPADLPAAINKADCFRLRARRELASNGFLMGFLNSRLARSQIRRFEQGVTRRRVNLSSLRQILVPVPPIAEQLAGQAVIEAIDGRLSSMSRWLEKIAVVKRGLMKDLLGGSVSVAAVTK